MSEQNAHRTHGAPAFAPDSVRTSQFTALVADAPQPERPPWTVDQNALLFNIALKKAEHDFQHRKRKDAAEEAGWITTTVAHRAKPTTGVEDEVKALASQFAGLPQGEDFLQSL